MRYGLSHLDQLESESLYILRETAEQFLNPAILFSGGKDSIVLVHLALRAFWPAKIPFSILHIDTGHNFKETIEFRDKFIDQLNLDLVVGSVEETIKNQSSETDFSAFHSRNEIQSQTLLEAINQYEFDALIGGARRDEEKARAKERYFSHRNKFGQWDPKNQRPELWNLFNGRKHSKEHFRIFPMNDWTETDVWEYIKARDIEVPNLYFSHEREVFERDDVLYAYEEFIDLLPEEKVFKAMVRFRTIGDITCSGAIRSNALNLEQVINEISNSKITERASRGDDKTSVHSMERRKRKGYF